jgi:F-type H+-transporting ATPase subunit b
MEQTLQALAGILLKAVPTIVLVLLVHFYLKSMLFKPLEETLSQRDQLSAGARAEAAEALSRADQKVAEYQQTIENARADAYRELEEQRKQWLQEQQQLLQETRATLDAKIAAAKEEIAKESALARQQLIESTAQLADEIAAAVLRGRSA